MRYLLDTNACISHLRQSASPVTGRLSIAEPGSVVLCSVVKAELSYGAHHSSNKEQNLEQVARFCSGFASLPFDDEAAEAYGEIRAHLAAQGTPIGPNDLLIAAIAQSKSLILVTHNTSEFDRVRDLKIEDWEI